MSENKEEFINSVKYSRFATENIQLRLTSLSNPTQQNIDSYVNNLCTIYIDAGKKTKRCRKTKTEIHHTQRRRYTPLKWYNTECESMRKSLKWNMSKVKLFLYVNQQIYLYMSYLNNTRKVWKKHKFNICANSTLTWEQCVLKKSKQILETIKWIK